MSVPPERRVLPDAETACGAVAALMATAAQDAIAARGRFVVALSGGRSPRPAYALFAGVPLEWRLVHVWFVDERCVPADHPSSNYRMVREALLDAVPIPDGQVHPLRGGLPPREAADRADAELRAADVLFDLAVTGAGADGHTASLFPGSASLAERERLVIATQAPPPFEVRDRLTLTLPALERVREVVMLATGADKRRALADAEREGLPVALVRGRERTTWVLDAAAAI